MVENAFGILANRFQILQKDINVEVETVQSIALTCCVLHNYIKQLEGKKHYLRGVDTEDIEEVTLTAGEWQTSVYWTNLQRCSVNRNADEPIAIRQKYMDYFNNVGFVPWQWEAIKKFNY